MKSRESIIICDDMSDTPDTPELRAKMAQWYKALGSPPVGGTPFHEGNLLEEFLNERTG